ncbi:virion structural protein [Escherichia phage RobRod40]
MKSISKAVYLGNTNGEYYGFTVGNTYSVKYFEAISENCFWCSDDDGVYRYVKNGPLHKFKLSDEDGYFVTEAECEVMPPIDDKKPELRYYINGHEVDVIEFGNVGRTVYELDRDGIKCDTIKFEVKFE